MSFFVETYKFKCIIHGEGECDFEAEILFPYKLYPFIEPRVFQDCIESSFVDLGNNILMFDDAAISDEMDEDFELLPINTKIDIIWSIMQLKVTSVFKTKLKVNISPSVSKILISFTQSGIKKSIEFSPEPGEEDNLQL